MQGHSTFISMHNPKVPELGEQCSNGNSSDTVIIDTKVQQAQMKITDGRFSTVRMGSEAAELPTSGCGGCWTGKTT